MRTTVHAFLIAVTAALLGGAHASAHHSFAAEFDAQKPVTLKGTVVKWEMINPHGWITLAVPGADGKTTEWMIETSNPNGLMRLGWSKRSLKFGDEVTVDAYRAKDGSNTANAATVTLADGRPAHRQGRHERPRTAPLRPVSDGRALRAAVTARVLPASGAGCAAAIA